MIKSSHVVRQLKWVYLISCLLTFAISGCASGKLNRARNAFYDGQLDQASGALADREEISTRNQLLYYMEKGLILHQAGDYQGSIDLLLNAAALIKDQDVISAGQQTASLVTSEWLTDYKGEYEERLLVHTYLMMNYLMTNNHESALVEAKQALEVYDAWPEACSADFFTRALVAHCFEALNEINGAYIEYKKLAELMSDPTPVARQLCNLGNRLGFYDEVDHFQQFLPKSELKKNDANVAGELLLFVSQGKSPVKIPHDIVIPPSIRFSFSTYQDRSGYLPAPDVSPLAGTGFSDMITTDVGEVLKASLKERLAQIIAKETARVVAKEAIAHNIHDDNIETLFRIAFFLMEVPDTRCWQTLPAYLTLIRIPLVPGKNQIHVNVMGENIVLPTIDLIPGKGPFYHYYAIRSGNRLYPLLRNTQTGE